MPMFKKSSYYHIIHRNIDIYKTDTRSSSARTAVMRWSNRQEERNSAKSHAVPNELKLGEGR